MSTLKSSMTSTTNNSCGEDVVKTNNEIIKILTLPPSGDLVSETPLNPDTAPNIIEDTLFVDTNQAHFMCNKDSTNGEEEQSFQVGNENSQVSQESINFRNTSKEREDDDENNPADETDESTSDSDYSDLSGLSDMSGKEWKPINQRPFNWVQKQIHSGVNPREILSKFLPSTAQHIKLPDMALWRILASALTEPPRRKKLSYVNTFEDVIDLLQKSKNIIVLTGAGVSVSCGIPDFRSSDGIYSRLAKDFPGLPNPQAMFDINYFSRDPRPFYKFAREIYPGQFKPSPCHRFIRMLEEKQKLLRNYTQNIDTLEQLAGIKNVIECHGSFSTASCTKCKYKCDAESIRNDIFSQRIPVCPLCQPNVEQSLDASEPVSENELKQLVENGIMKPDIVFFGEGLPDEFHTVMASDKDKCDLLIVMGSSLKVRPVALIPSSIPKHVPQILINREQLLHHLEFDVELLGDGDMIINQICHRLGEEWKSICFNEEVLQESKHLIPLEEFIDDEYTVKDTDALSMKPNHSSELVMQSATNIHTTYSDSGFELSSSCSKKGREFLSPDDLDEPMESTSFGGSCDYRHLSIDSSKDSGILGDGSNSALPPSFSNFADSADLKNTQDIPKTQVLSNKPGVSNLHNTKTADNNCSEAEKLRNERQLKHKSAAEFLYKGTYYAHENSAAYIFPGAQVSWCTDSEDDDDENLRANGENHCNDDDDTGHSPLSPLLTPSVENEMVKAIASTAAATQQSCSVSINFTNAVASNACLSQTKIQAQAPQHQTQLKRTIIEASVESQDSPKSSAIEVIYNSDDASCVSSHSAYKRQKVSNINLEFP